MPSPEGNKLVSNLTAIERDLLDSCISKLKVYLDFNNVNLEAPVLSEQEQITNNMLNAVTMYKSVIEQLQSRLDIIDNPENNEHVKLEDNFSKLSVNYEVLQNQNQSLQSKIESLTDINSKLTAELNSIIGEYPNLAKLLVPKLEAAKPNAKTKEIIAPLRAPELAEALTDYIHNTEKLVRMVNTYSKYDIKAVDRILGGEKTSYQEINTEVTRIINLAWNIDITKN